MPVPSLSVKSDVKKLTRGLRRSQKKQVPFATALALTRTAQSGQKMMTNRIRRDLDRPTKFTQKAMGIRTANKRTLLARVFIKDKQFDYLRLQIYGGTRTPRGRALLMPRQINTNKYGNIPRGAIKRAFGRPRTFSGRIGGVSGIWERTGKKGKLKLLVAYKDSATYRPGRLKFRRPMDALVRKAFPGHFRRAFRRAVSSAR